MPRSPPLLEFTLKVQDKDSTVPPADERDEARWIQRSLNVVKRSTTRGTGTFALEATAFLYFINLMLLI